MSENTAVGEGMVLIRIEDSCVNGYHEGSAHKIGKTHNAGMVTIWADGSRTYKKLRADEIKARVEAQTHKATAAEMMTAPSPTVVETATPKILEASPTPEGTEVAPDAEVTVSRNVADATPAPPKVQESPEPEKEADEPKKEAGPPPLGSMTPRQIIQATEDFTAEAIAAWIKDRFGKEVSSRTTKNRLVEKAFALEKERAAL